MLTPKEIYGAAITSGVSKIEMMKSRPLASAVLAIFAGAYIALGGMLSVAVGWGFPEWSGSNPSLRSVMSGAVFPIGLILIVVLGGELFTGNNAVLVPGAVHRRFSILDVAKNWVWVWVLNFVGALIFAWAFVSVAGMFDAQPYNDAICRIATFKSEMNFWTVFVKGIGANWCVCLAVWMALSGRTLGAKVIGCWLPVFAFVALGFEHCIANMFFIPAGMLCGAEVSVGSMLTNLLPATLGNIVGGALLVGGLNAYIHGARR